MNRETLLTLANKILNGQASEAEIGQYNAWYNSRQRGEDFEIPEAELKKAAIYAGIVRTIDVPAGETPPLQTKRLWLRISATAAALAAVALFVYFFRSPAPGSNDRETGTYALHEILPGRNGATITLEDGRVLRLSSKKSGLMIGDKLKYSDGTLVGDAEQSPEARENPGKAQQIVARTGMGQTYQFVLPDGTKVWLNAGSTLEFPARLANNTVRNIKLSGEAYFAVAHRAGQPFRVESSGPGGNRQVVEDIGTAFNINAYPDEPNIRTTLLEGSASVQGQVLTPSQQATFTGTDLQIAAANVEEAVSWKNGYFRFNDEKLGSIMKKLGRWYDVTVIFEDDTLAGVGFTGTISRSKNLAQVLSMLEKTRGVHFEIEGRRLIISE